MKSQKSVADKLIWYEYLKNIKNRIDVKYFYIKTIKSLNKEDNYKKRSKDNTNRHKMNNIVWIKYILDNMLW